MADRDIADGAMKSERSADEIDRALKAKERREARHEPVTVSLKRTADGRLDVDSPHNDTSGWQNRLVDAFGTRSDAFAIGQLSHLIGMIRSDEPEVLEAETNRMLAAVEAVRPENEMEGMLAVQMAATHQMAMGCLQRASRAYVPEEVTPNINLATKLFRAFSMQFEALAKARRGGTQKVTVKHVHINEGGQALVGNVAGGSASPTEGRVSENGRQPHAPRDGRALTPPAGEALRSPDTSRWTVPVTSGEG